MKKESPKDASHLKNDKYFSHSKRYKKDIKKGKNEKRKVQEKFNNLTMTIKFFKFYFLYMEKDIFCSKF